MRYKTMDCSKRVEGAVRVFHAADAIGKFPSGAWSTRENAERWIRAHHAHGTLSAYILDESAYDSSVRLGLLKLSGPDRSTAEYKRKFTTAVDHVHFQD
jgi:hypothetical protein